MNGGIYVLTEFQPTGFPGNSTVYYKNIRIKPLD
jgi:hypothetical protein